MKSKCSQNCWMLAFVLACVGAINWGLVGLFDFNLVEALLGQWAMAEMIVYVLVGLSGLYLLVHMLMGGMNCSAKK